MLVTLTEFEKYSGTTRDTGDTLGNIYIGSATDIISAYLKYDVLTAERFRTEAGTYVYPDIIKLTCLRIASLMQLEEDSNIGVNSKSFGDSGTRSFVNVVNYDKYLAVISEYRDVK